MTAIRRLEGYEVSIALTDGSRIDAAALMSVGRLNEATVWIYSNGTDVFIPTSRLRDVWQSSGNTRLDRPTG